MLKFLATLLLFLGLLAPARAQQNDPGCSPAGSTQLVSCRQFGLGNDGYPIGSTPITAGFSGANTTSAQAVLTPLAGQFAYICGLSVNGLGATAQTFANVNLQNAQSGFQWTGMYQYVAGAAVANPGFPSTGWMTFTPCLRANAISTNINIVVGGAAGNTSTIIEAAGYSK